MSIKKIIAIQADPIEKINIKTDTTFLLALEAQKRNYKIYWYQTKDLHFVNSKLFVDAEEVKFYEKKKKYFKIIKKNKFDLSKAKYVLIRQNPPFNMDYITSTLFLDTIKNKTKIINNPTSVRNISEKLFSINFLKFMPPTIFTKNIKEIKKFQKKYKKVVIKPIHGYAGKDILFLDGKFNLKKIEKYVKKFNHVMVQKFLPGITKGDKRVFIINGTVKGAIKRIPSKNSILSNLSQGGKAFRTILNSRELNISNHVAKKLKKQNIFFAGIDLVSNYLIGDINVTSPTGLKNHYDLTGINLAVVFWNTLEKLK